jgi:CHASE2 domain-containing sensor protein
LIICGIWAAIFALLAGPLNLVPLELAEFSLQDAVVRHGLRSPTPDNFAFLALDEGSLDLSQLDPEEIAGDPVLTMMARAFPWSRAVYAAAVEKILAAGAKTVVLDAHFPLEGEGDAVLRETLQRHPGRVALASLYLETEMSNATDALLYHPPVETVVAPGDAAEDGIGDLGQVRRALLERGDGDAGHVDGLVEGGWYLLADGEDARGARPVL